MRNDAVERDETRDETMDWRAGQRNRARVRARSSARGVRAFVAACAALVNVVRGENVAIVGVGATFPASVYSEAMMAYAQATPNVTVTYKAFGSGGGLCRIKNGASTCVDGKGTYEVDFSCSDGLLDASSYSTYGDLQMYPALAGAVTLVYNLPESSGSTPLRLDANTLLGIFLGNITRWNHGALAALNPNLSLPNEAIRVTVRADSSGTTEVFAGAMASMNATFASAIGSNHLLPMWPMSFTNRTGGIGVASYVRATNYSIGYAVLADAVSVNASVAGYLHAGTSTPVFPSPESIEQAVKTRGLQFGNNGDSPTRLTATIAPTLSNVLAWPFTTYTYFVLRTGMSGFTASDRLRTGATCENVIQTVAFWRWFLSDARAYRIANKHGFAPLRDEIGALVLARLIADVHCNGQRVGTVTSVEESPRFAARITAPMAVHGVLSTIRALLEARNSSATLAISSLTTADAAASDIIRDNGAGIGLTLVGTPLAVFMRMPLFSLEGRMGFHRGVLQLGAGGTGLTLDARATAAILSGEATFWGHSEIVRLNSFLSGVTASIVLAGIVNAESDAFYRSYTEQLVALNSSFTVARPEFAASSYETVAAYIVEKERSIAFLPNDVIAYFEPDYFMASSSLGTMTPLELDLYLKPAATGDECVGEKFQTLYGTLSLLEWIGSNADLQAVIHEQGISTPFSTSTAVTESFLSNLRSVTCDGKEILDPGIDNSSTRSITSPLVVALSIGLGLLATSVLFIFGGSLARSFFVQTILNQYKRSHPPSDEEVTIVVTDIESSTKIWQVASVHMNRALAVHDKIIRTAIHQTFGYEVLTEGDSFTVAFHTALDAVRFAMLVQERMHNYAWDAPIANVCRQVYEENDQDAINQPSLSETRTGELLLKAVSTQDVIHEDIDFQDNDSSSDAAALPVGNRGIFLNPTGTVGARVTEQPRINGLRVRIGMHTGFCQSRFHPTTRRREYYKGAVTVAHAVSDCALGGQTVISADTLAAMTGGGKESSGRFFALHMGKHELALSKKEFDAAHVVTNIDALSKGLRDLVDEELPTEAAHLMTAHTTALRLRRSDSSHHSTEEGSVEMYPAYRQSQQAKVSLIKTLASQFRDDSTLVEAELLQAVPSSLATRLTLFSGLRTVRQIEPSYFDSPGLRDMQVTIVFTYIENIKQMSAALKEDMDESIAILNAAVRATLPVYNGYEVREANGEFLLAFHNPSDAYKWALLAQSAFMKLDWPKRLLAHRSARRVRAGKYDVFIGLRVGMGVCSGICTDIRPCARTGRAEYFGPIMNKAARLARGAVGGQILTDYNSLNQAMDDGYRMEFCHDLGTFSFKGLSEPMRVIQVSDASLSMRAFEEIDAVRVGEAIGLDDERTVSFHSVKDRQFKTVCLVLCSPQSPVVDVISQVVKATHRNMEVIPASTVEQVVSQIRLLHTARRIQKHFVIITNELAHLDIVSTCRKIRRRLNIYMQPFIAAYTSLILGNTAEELGIDAILPNYDVVKGEGSSRSSYVDGDSDSDEETDIIEFKQAVENFFADGKGDGGQSSHGRGSHTMSSVEAPDAVVPGSFDPEVGVARTAPIASLHAKPLLSMSTLGLLTTTLDAVSARAFGIDENGRLVFATRAAMKAGVGKSSTPLPETEWLGRVSVIAARAQEGMIRQTWSETIKHEWLDEGLVEDIKDAVHRPLRLGENLAIVLVTWTL